MTLTLDPATEKHVQREIELGHFREPAQVVARAVALLREQESQAFDASHAPVRHDEVLSGEAARQAVDQAFGLWADLKEDGLAYQERMRSEW